MQLIDLSLVQYNRQCTKGPIMFENYRHKYNGPMAWTNLALFFFFLGQLMDRFI